MTVHNLAAYMSHVTKQALNVAPLLDRYLQGAHQQGSLSKHVEVSSVMPLIDVNPPERS
jgi:hypothetical protein